MTSLGYCMTGNTMSRVKRSTSLRPYRSMTHEGMADRARGEPRRPRTGGRCPPRRAAHCSALRASMAGTSARRDRARIPDPVPPPGVAQVLSTLSVPSPNRRPPSWPLRQWRRSVLRQNGGAQEFGAALGRDGRTVVAV